jgi:hypothetical protein
VQLGGVSDLTRIRRRAAVILNLNVTVTLCCIGSASAYDVNGLEGTQATGSAGNPIYRVDKGLVPVAGCAGNLPPSESKLLRVEHEPKERSSSSGPRPDSSVMTKKADIRKFAQWVQKRDAKRESLSTSDFVKTYKWHNQHRSAVAPARRSNQSATVEAGTH